MSNKTNLILDVVIFAAFLVAASPALTGNTIHEWLSVAFTAAIITHLLFHWKWIVRVTAEFFKKLMHQSRLNYIVDALFFIAMTGALFSGLMISKDVLAFFGISLGETSGAWKQLHHQTSDISVLLLGLHFALHWDWVVDSLRRYVVQPVMNLFHHPAPEQNLAAQPVRIDESK